MIRTLFLIQTLIFFKTNTELQLETEQPLMQSNLCDHSEYIVSPFIVP